MAEGKEATKDEIDASILEASNLDFHTYVQNEDGTCRARVLNYIEQVQKLDDKFLKLLAENAAMMAHDLFFIIEKFRQILENDFLESTASDDEDESLEENIDEDSNHCDGNPDEKANLESYEGEQME
ncbi:uncharacterized protein LOC123873916 isoform X1 [Maniola jurtina]|uniref:uncharacterized protein LOC123873916 isoform X1 n=1 Tax=Maniola jurtina TaxID=191418 RepID=UPI001E689793|nr:uncharacterized protein LOC123873916 isoform X1 [Maniola jurtina]